MQNLQRQCIVASAVQLDSADMISSRAQYLYGDPAIPLPTPAFLDCRGEGMLYDADQAERMRTSCRMLQVECHFRASDLKGENVDLYHFSCQWTVKCQEVSEVVGMRAVRPCCIPQQRGTQLPLPLGLQGSRRLQTAHCTGHSPVPALVQLRASSGAMPLGLPPGLAAMLRRRPPSTMGWVTVCTCADVHPCSYG